MTPLGILQTQNATRLSDLVPLRTERMSASEFAFYRGTAAIMAADLADSPDSGISVASCGDAHVANFGLYAGPQRTLVFDLNDFDEAAWAPWEWDVKRLVTSVIVAARSTNRADAVTLEAASECISTYLRSLGAAVKKSPSQRFFSHYTPAQSANLLEGTSRQVLDEAARTASKRTGERAVRRLTTRGDDGRLQFIEKPPTMMHQPAGTTDQLAELIDQYRQSVQVDIQVLLRQYELVDFARRVVGVGSVGTRCYLGLFQSGVDDAMLLQVKEAGESVLIEYGRAEQPEQVAARIGELGDGGRVVGLQRILQAVSDPLLGYLRGPKHDFYVRQFHDMKGSVEVETLDDAQFVQYSQACGAVLARAHSQSPTAPAVVGYAGKGRSVSQAIIEWSYKYAERASRDYRDYVAAASA